MGEEGPGAAETAPLQDKGLVASRLVVPVTRFVESDVYFITCLLLVDLLLFCWEFHPGEGRGVDREHDRPVHTISASNRSLSIR